MDPPSVSWDELRGRITILGPWRVGVLFEPAGGEAPGGDRFAVERTRDAMLAFYLADATGHGRKGARFWQVFGELFERSWKRFAADPDEHTLVRFARDVNDALHEGHLVGDSTLPGSQLCLAAGWTSREGSLVFANFGLGVHVVPTTEEGLWYQPPEESFGFRLGWVSSNEWSRYDRALVIQRISGLRRLLLASDAFFGNDHWDPESALRRVQDLGKTTMSLTLNEVIDYAAGLPHEHDDATFLIVEPASPLDHHGLGTA